MPKIIEVRPNEQHRGRDGFVIVYEYNGINQSAVKGRAVSRLAPRFPMKAKEIEVIDISVKRDESGKALVRTESESGLTTYILEIFIPKSSKIEELTTEKFMSMIEDLT